jgi:hypothetical protein
METTYIKAITINSIAQPNTSVASNGTGATSQSQ